MKKITILALHLGYGGIEKCISNLSNMLVDNYKVEIVSTYELYEKPVFYIDDRVKITYLKQGLKPNKKEINYCIKHFKFIKLFKELIKAKKIIKLKKNLMINYIKSCDSDVIVSTRDIHNLWLGMYGNNKTLKIGWEHNYHNNNQKYIKRIVSSVKNLDYFVLVSKELELFYKDLVNCKTISIPNCLDYYPNKMSNLSDKRIVSIGRLSKEKGYLDLIDVFKLVNDNYKDWTLDIIGDGVEKEKIEEKIKKYHLENNVILHGYQNKEYINNYLQNSSIYVMTSLTESFGIVLLEASSFGIPCVAFTSANGANEIIKDNWDGYLIENRDKAKMAKRIMNLINNKNRRLIMGDNAYKKSLNYSFDIIKEKWVDIIEKK